MVSTKGPHKHEPGVDHCHTTGQNLKFSIFDKMSVFKTFYFDYLPREKRLEKEEKHLTKTNKLWKYAYKKFGDELNAVSMLQTIQKLKASIEVLVKSHEHSERDMVHKIKDAYLHNATVYDCENKNEEHEKMKS